jgi:opacity protein-like surface antigen
MDFTLISLALGYGKMVNEGQLYLGVEINAHQDVCVSGLFVGKINLLGRFGWECTHYMLPYLAAGLGGTNIQGSKGDQYEAYPHLAGAAGVEFKFFGWLVVSPVIEGYVSINDFQNVRYQADGKIKVEFQYSF